MFDGDGAETMELQAKKVMQNAMHYRGSAPCPTCGVIMNPVEFMYNQGKCLNCLTQQKASRIKGKMV